MQVELSIHGSFSILIKKRETDNVNGASASLGSLFHRHIIYMSVYIMCADWKCVFPFLWP